MVMLAPNVDAASRSVLCLPYVLSVYYAVLCCCCFLLSLLMRGVLGIARLDEAGVLQRGDIDVVAAGAVGAAGIFGELLEEDEVECFLRAR